MQSVDTTLSNAREVHHATLAGGQRFGFFREQGRPLRAQAAARLGQQ